MLENNRYGIVGVLLALVSGLAFLYWVGDSKSQGLTDDEVSSQSKTVQIDPPSSVTRVNNDPEARKKKTGKVRITQDTLDRIAGGMDTVVSVPLFDGEVIQVQLEERQPLGTMGTLVYGRIQKEADSVAHFSIVKNAMYAEFTLEDGREFKIESLPYGKHEYQLIEVDTVTVLHHRNPPGSRIPRFINGKRVVACYRVDVPKSPLPLRKMLGQESWEPEMKVIASDTGQVGFSDRIELRQPYEKSDYPPKPRKDTEPKVKLLGAVKGSVRWVDVGIWYTPQAAANVGSPQKVAARAGGWIAGASAANRKSGVEFMFQGAGDFVYKIDKEFDGFAIGDSLGYISGGASAEVNAIHDKWRDDNQADLISLMIDGRRVDQAAGLGQLLGSLSGNQGTAFNSCLHNVGSGTFAHECGHNMGLGHDATEGTSGIQSNSWGNHFPDPFGSTNGYRTIMAYSKTGFERRVNMWSSPKAYYKGVPTGTQAADAVGTLNQTCIPVSEYR